jgi:C_GCAxxG_C_C family probable redox protein
MELNPAQQLAARRYHCSEAVLATVCQELGIANDLVPRIASVFAGGMAESGGVCGAVTGALMAISIKHGRDEAGQSDEEAHRLGAEFLRAFREETGSLYCRELTGADLSTPEGRAQFRASDVPIRVCLPAIGFAYQRTLELLGLAQSEAGA